MGSTGSGSEYLLPSRKAHTPYRVSSNLQAHSTSCSHFHSPLTRGREFLLRGGNAPLTSRCQSDYQRSCSISAEISSTGTRADILTCLLSNQAADRCRSARRQRTRLSSPSSSATFVLKPSSRSAFS